MVDVADFVFKHVLRHVDSFDNNIMICFPQLLCGFMLSQLSSIFNVADIAGSKPKIISLSYRLFQGSHVLDLSSNFHHS